MKHVDECSENKTHFAFVRLNYCWHGKLYCGWQGDKREWSFILRFHTIFLCLIHHRAREYNTMPWVRLFVSKHVYKRVRMFFSIGLFMFVHYLCVCVLYIPIFSPGPLSQQQCSKPPTLFLFSSAVIVTQSLTLIQVWNLLLSRLNYNGRSPGTFPPPGKCR